jgi:ribosomal 50S subunit-recycling heat shock protein
MKTKLSVVLIGLSMVAVLALGAATTGYAQEEKGVEIGDSVVIAAEVLAIDKEDRILTLMGPKENVVDVVVGEEARNFDQIKVGDELEITYYESVAIYIGKPGTQPDENAGMVVARSAKGEKPGGYAVGAIDVSASVVGIDKKERTLTLELPEGNVVTTEVDEDVKAFDTLKVGDTIHARLTKAIAIKVETP